MNKRARLARRILREHRQGWPWHRSFVATSGSVKLYEHWACPHCASPKSFVSYGSPRADR